jgi:hypothetical protein
MLETSPQKQKEQRQKQLGADKFVTTQIWKLKHLMSLFSDVFFLPVHQVDNLLKETADNETGMAEKASWDQATDSKKLDWLG